MREHPLFPDRASTFAGDVDLLFLFELLVGLFFAGLIAVLIIFFAVRYRRRSEDEKPARIEGNLLLELLWIGVPLAISMVMFAWGAKVYLDVSQPPENASEIYVVGKQWMWKLQHPTGQREINRLHVPTGRPIKLIMTSEDVIHSFFVPAFRTKADVVPGRFTTAWFEATSPGEYHLFCAEYCGTSHSEMIGKVIVMEPVRFQEWLSGGQDSLSLSEKGEKLFNRLGCNACHEAGDSQRGPSLRDLFGKQVPLKSGGQVTADEAYLRESILKPDAKRVEGFEPVMPTYTGQVNEEEIVQIIAYIKSLNAEEKK